jgi:hypothetical protein
LQGPYRRRFYEDSTNKQAKLAKVTRLVSDGGPDYTVREDPGMAERIGDFLVRTKAMQQSQVEAVLQAQKDGDKRTFGEIAVALGFVSQSALASYRAS